MQPYIQLISIRLWIALCIVAGVFSSAQAQFPQTRLDWLFPAGLQSGSTAEIQLSGADLEGLTALKFSHPGLTAKPGKDGRWAVSSSAAVSPGLYAVQAVGPWGISNPLPLAVGPLPEVRETEPNDTQPQALVVPVTVNAQIQQATDVDSYQISGKKGQRLFISLLADRIDSPLDATLRLFSPSGAQLDESQDVYGYDPALDIVLPADGTYKLQVFDAIYGGSPAYAYRLGIHGGPVVDAVIPAAVAPNTATPLKIAGRGFGAAADPGFAKIQSAAQESVSQLFKPAQAQLHSNMLGNYSNADAPDRLGLAEISGTRLTLAWPLAQAVAPVFAEIETNDEPRLAQPLQPPFDVTGVIQKPGDVDFYQFHARKDETWVIETVAERQQSLADPIATVERLQKDGKTQVLAELSDSFNNPFGPIFEKATTDGRLQWKAPEEGDFLIRLVHSNPRQGDARHYYRVIMRPLKPDFRLVALPSNATGPAGTTLLKNGRTVVSIMLEKMDGFDQAVQVRAADLPNGVKAYPAVIPAGQNRTVIILEADSQAAITEFPLVLTGSTRWADQKSSLDWLPGQSPEMAFENTMPSKGGGLVRPLAGQNNQQRGISRYSPALWVAVRDTAGPFQLEPEPLRLFAKRGTTVDLPVNATRAQGFDAPIALKLENPPAQMEAVAGNIEKGKNVVVLKCKIGANVPLDRQTVYISGTAPFAFAKDPAAKQKPNINWTIPSRPVTLIITP